MRTLEEIKGNCTIEEDAAGREHWIWNGSYQVRKKGNCESSSPVVRAPDFARDPSGKLTWPMYGARAVYMLKHGKPPKPGTRAARTCAFEGCMNPECIKAMTPRVSTKLAFERARPQREHVWREAALRGWDLKGRKIDDATVLAAATTPGRLEDVAQQLGIHVTTVSRYRRGELRKKAVQAEMGPFAGLLR